MEKNATETRIVWLVGAVAKNVKVDLIITICLMTESPAELTFIAKVVSVAPTLELAKQHSLHTRLGLLF